MTLVPHELLVVAVESLRVPFAVVSADPGCLFASSAFLSLLGAPSPERLAVQEFWPSFSARELREGEVATHFMSQAGESLPVKLDISSLGNSLFLVKVVAASAGAGGNAYHAQRLETLGMLAGGVAHDFNNILAGILGHITYLKTILPASGPHCESLDAIEEGARKASTMTRQILNFSKLEGAEEVSRVELGSLTVRTCNLLRGALSPDYTIDVQIPEYPVHLLAGEGKLSQVLVNLVINARDASKTGSTIEVAVGRESDRGVLVQAFGTDELAAGAYAFVAVRDQGHGMSAEVMQRIFEPYFSTKKDKGTGLGLTTVASIVRGFGGAITLESLVDVGTTIKVYLPLVELNEAAAARTSGTTRAPRLAGGEERILVIDDESPVRSVLALSLQHLGYEVDVAESGMEGIERYTAEDGRYDLVILDMLMPQVSGSEVFFRLREIRPDTRVLLMSGFTSEESIRKVMSAGGKGFLQKPFTIEDLSQQVRACLDD